MTGSSVALDTSVAIAVLNGQGNIGEWIQGFVEVNLPVPVVGELCYGALNSRNARENLLRVESLASHCHILEMRRRTAEIYAELRLDLKSKGRPIPENDLWIAALCVENDIALATDDAHFDSVDGLQVSIREL